jgi:hypothetical protein
VHQAAERLIELGKHEFPQLSETQLRKRFRAGGAGQRTCFASEDAPLARAAITSTAPEVLLAAGKPIPAPASLQARSSTPHPYARRAKRRRGFLASSLNHAKAKDLANAEYIELLRHEGALAQHATGALGYWDAWTGMKSLALRTTDALLGAGVPPGRMYCAHPDHGVVARMQTLGVNTQQGLWADAVLGWPQFSGVYLDLCDGSGAKALDEVRALTGRCLQGCVLGVTLVQRDFDGESLPRRQARLIDELQGRGWQPARRGQLEASLLEHRSGRGQNVLTQFWRLSS